MKVALRIAILAAIIGILGAAFLLWSIPGVVPWARETTRATETFELADRRFRSDLLGARIGLLRNYDSLNRASADQRAAVTDLKRFAVVDPALYGEVTKLAAMVDQREAVAEHFKSTNALVHNSLARFVILSQSTPQSAGLSAQMLRLMLDTSPSIVGATNASIADLADTLQRTVRSNSATPTAPVLTHVRLLARALPESDALLGRILAFPVDAQVAKIRALAVQQLAQEDAANRRTQIATEVTIGAFFVFMISTRLRLIGRARGLRRSVEVEHIGGTVSALLIDAQSHDLPQRIERGLAALGGYMEADYAFLVLHGDPPNVFSWSRADEPLDSRPFDLVDAAAEQRWVGDRLRVTQGDSGVSEGLARQMKKAGLQSMKLVRSRDNNPCPATLGCGLAKAGLKEGGDVQLVCQMALAAILQAVRRDLLEDERGQLERELQQARRMETIGAMATGVAHNFNNIMGVIGGFAETAALHVSPVSPAASNLEEISHAVDRARDLVDQILTFGRRSTERRARINIADLLAETARMLRALNPKVAVYVSVESDVTEILGLASQVQQVIMNIGQNAAHAMQQDGTIEIVATCRSLSRPLQLSHGRLVASRYAVIEISDFGPGIDPAILPHIFNPFFTTRQGGTGLGLSTAWEVTETHGGSIDVRSDAGGSRFALWLPLVGKHAAPATGDASGGNGRGDRVLLVSRDARRIDGDEEILAVLGYEPVGIVARTLPIDLPPLATIDIILLIETDVDAEWASAALAHLREASSGLPILLATEIAARRHLQLPGVIPVCYPFHVQRLAAALSTAVQSSVDRLVPVVAADEAEVAPRTTPQPVSAGCFPRVRRFR